MPNPCIPSPCGPNAICTSVNNAPNCLCQPEFSGAPPNCRPECRINSECPNHLACMNKKCTDPCPGSCGINAMCQVAQHRPSCTCLEEYTGDPFTLCTMTSSKMKHSFQELNPSSRMIIGIRCFCKKSLIIFHLSIVNI